MLLGDGTTTRSLRSRDGVGRPRRFRLLGRPRPAHRNPLRPKAYWKELPAAPPLPGVRRSLPHGAGGGAAPCVAALRRRDRRRPWARPWAVALPGLGRGAAHGPAAGAVG